MKRIYKITIMTLLGGIAVMIFMCILFILALLYLPSCIPLEPHYVTQEEKLQRYIESIEKDSIKQANSSRQTKEEGIVSWP